MPVVPELLVTFSTAVRYKGRGPKSEVSGSEFQPWLTVRDSSGLKIKQQQITLRSWVYFVKTRKQTPPLPQTKNKGTGTSASLCRLVKSS